MNKLLSQSYAFNEKAVIFLVVIGAIFIVLSSIFIQKEDSQNNMHYLLGKFIAPYSVNFSIKNSTTSKSGCKPTLVGRVIVNNC